MEAIGTFSFKCNKCGKQHDFTDEDIYFEITSTEEKPQGSQREYIWEDIFTCDVCENEIEIEYHVWEYPVGAFNDDNIKLIGATKLKCFTYEFNDDDDDDANEDDF